MPGMRGFGRGGGRPGFGSRGFGRPGLLRGHRGFGRPGGLLGLGFPGLRPMVPGRLVLRRNSNWLMIGSLAAILLAGGATAQAIKLSQDDLHRVHRM